MNKLRPLHILLAIVAILIATPMLLIFTAIKNQVGSAGWNSQDSLTWYVSQIDFELSSLKVAMDSYQQNQKNQAEFKAVKRQFDALRSRILYAKDSPFGNSFSALASAPELITQTRSSLDEIESLLPALKERNEAAFVRASSKLTDLRAPLLSVLLTLFRQSAEIVEQQRVELIKTFWWIFGLYGGFLLSGVAVLGMYYRDRQQITRVQDELKGRVTEHSQEIDAKIIELEQANEHLRQFALAASHDLQEPLRRIKIFATELSAELGNKVTDEQLFAIDSISKAAARLRVMVARLLSYALISQRALHREPVDLEEIVNDILRDRSDQIDAAHAKVVVGLLPTLFADPMQMRQLFQNLISNAIKYRSSHRPCEIEIMWEQMRDFDKISVRDNGRGFLPKYKDEIFKPFQQLHGKNEYGGSGIGLAICRRVIERHGWSVEVAAQPDEGAVFTILIDRCSLCSPENRRAA